MKYDADFIISQEDDHMMKTLTNFKCQEFLIFFQVIEPYLENAHTSGRKPKLSIKTMFLIALCSCKHALSFVFLQMQFGYDNSYLKRIVFQTISICHNILFNFAVRWISQKENERDGILFEHFPFATRAIDASVQVSKSNLDWYSGKHKKHCIKMQAAVGPKGLLIDLRGSVKGSTHDFKMFQKSGLLNIYLSEMNRYISMFPNKFAPTAIFDKGYIEIKNIYPGAETPSRKQETD